MFEHIFMMKTRVNFEAILVEKVVGMNLQMMFKPILIKKIIKKNPKLRFLLKTQNFLFPSAFVKFSCS